MDKVSHFNIWVTSKNCFEKTLFLFFDKHPKYISWKKFYKLFNNCFSRWVDHCSDQTIVHEYLFSVSFKTLDP